MILLLLFCVCVCVCVCCAAETLSFVVVVVCVCAPYAGDISSGLMMCVQKKPMITCVQKNHEAKKVKAEACMFELAELEILKNEPGSSLALFIDSIFLTCSVGSE